MNQQSSGDSFAKRIAEFGIKAAIAFFLFIMAVSSFMPDPRDFAASVRKAAKDEKTRVLLLSLISNPASLYRASEIDENKGDLPSAIMEMETAIGQLELHSANPQIINRYTTRLNNLKDEVKGKKIGREVP
jgi:hypothetical protein